MKRSVAFFYLGLKHIFPNHHRKLHFSEVIKIYKGYLNIVLKDIKKIDYKRVYIEKGDTFRPLGVPKPV
jgi:hypothetical protein